LRLAYGELKYWTQPAPMLDSLVASRKQLITLGIAVASAVLAIFVPILMALPLFVVAAPLAKLDSMLSGWS
jgi:hypothetical protein